MKCLLCKEEKETLKNFYWGFFSNEYEKDKWILLCDECCLKFLKASNIYNFNRTPLIEMEKEIKKKVRNKK